MARMELGTIESIQATRSEDEYGWVELRITTEDGESVKFTIGRFYDDAATLAELLTSAAKDADGIVRDWQDLPDESDGYVYEDRGRYYVSLDGSSWEGCFPAPNAHSRYRFPGYPTRDIATYELAAAMTNAGYFPNAWYQDDRGNTFDIGDEVRKFHDADGDGLLPLDGEYEDDADISARIFYGNNESGFHSASVVKDYGTLGIVYVLSGDDERRFTEDRADVRPYVDDEDED